MQVKIDNQTYSLMFGFGALRLLGERYGIEDYPSVIELIQEAFVSFDKISFKQEDVIKGIIVTGAQFAKDENAECLEDLSVIDFMISDGDTFQKIITEVTNAFSKDMGKQKASKTPRKTPTKKENK